MVENGYKKVKGNKAYVKASLGPFLYIPLPLLSPGPFLGLASDPTEEPKHYYPVP